ncbi:MAG: sugar transferase [Candidatus Omnitrophica bacterium]|nr:sugar transferase [Candidatus Omnitrophota bacterium]MDD5352356.1 sugar transferase [Candidatus Omnitrophota bacterium]MDD5549954.1 sugar transferase [Candidatus Omnitrophota bacterium]
MIKSSRKIYPFYLLVDILIIAICLLLSYIIRYRANLLIEKSFPYFIEYAFIFTLWGIFIITSFNRKNLYSTDRSLTIPKETTMVILSTLYISVLMSTIIFFAQYKFFSRKVFLISFLLLCVSLTSWRIIKRLILRKLIKDGFHNINILLVGMKEDTAKIIVEEIRRNPHWGFKIVGFLDDQLRGDINNIPVLGKLKDLTIVVKKYFIDEIIITTSLENKTISELIGQAKRLPLGIRLMTDNFTELEQILNISYLGIIPLLTYKERKLHPAELFLKRLFDLTIALLVLILFMPLFIIISILIKIDSSGSVFYTQKRVGSKGKIFKLYKFRSMIKDADKLKDTLLDKNEVKDGIIFKIRRDPRITRLGIFLRKTSLDEFPQLFNVIKGDMSLVGPRPPTPEEVKKYNHFHMDRLSIKPGITGLSQVKGRSSLTFRKWVKWDLWYVNHWSFMLDLKILLLTIPAVIKGRGAY